MSNCGLFCSKISLTAPAVYSKSGETASIAMKGN